MNSSSSTLGKRLIERIIALFPKKGDAADAIAEILSISKPSAYKKLNGSTNFSLEEVERLVLHFNISLDNLISGGPGKIYFIHNAQNQPITSFYDFLSQLDNQFKALKKLTGLRFYYTSRDVPVFMFLMFPNLLAFKLYVFGVTTWSFNYLKNRPFSLDLLTPQELEFANSISKNYCSFDSIDIWTLSILDQTLHQIEYIAEEKRFNSPEEGLAICDDVERFVLHTQEMATHGEKFLPDKKPSGNGGIFDLFHNELAHTANIILGLSDQLRMVYHTLDSPNFIYSSDASLANLLEDWFQNIQGYSLSLSKFSRRNRTVFFNHLLDRVKESRKKLENIFEQY